MPQTPSMIHNSPVDLTNWPICLIDPVGLIGWVGLIGRVGLIGLVGLMDLVGDRVPNAVFGDRIYFGALAE
jgi:hypothetical protein